MTSTKGALRAAALVRRQALSAEALEAAALGLCERALQLPELAVATIALYVSIGAEPGTGPLLAALHERGARVLLPALRPDLSLDWAVHQGPGALRPGPRGTCEPVGPGLGPQALAQADVVLVPGLLADRRGNRLGRGGGSYDRALTRRGPDALVVVLLHAGEIVDAVPAEAHDVPVDAALTPAGLVRLATR